MDVEGDTLWKAFTLGLIHSEAPRRSGKIVCTAGGVAYEARVPFTFQTVCSGHTYGLFEIRIEPYETQDVRSSVE